MPSEQLKILTEPQVTAPRMVLSLSGWMDGGEVSTGTVQFLVQEFGAEKVAEIEPEDFYIYNFPGSMEISSLFRPHVEIEEGLIRRLDFPSNVFHYSESQDLILFEGKEPHINWTAFVECIFSLASHFNVERIYFIGSYAGLMPHTREPRIHSSVSDESLKAELEPYGIRFSNYEGPGSVVTYLTTLAAERGLRLATLVAEIPPYVQGRNPKCIESMVRRVAAVLGLGVDLDGLRKAGDIFEERLNAAVRTRERLPEQIRKLEAEYDNEMFETQMSDLKDWLEQQGIRLD